MMWYKKIFVYLKKYWWFFILAIVLFVLVFLGRDASFVAEMLERKNKQAAAELDAIKEASEKVTAAREENLETYLKTIESLEKQYDISSNQIRSKTKKKIQKFIKSSEKDPEAIARQIAEENGWEYVK